MATVYYTCNLLPPALVTRTGHSLRWLGDGLEDATAPARREALGVHPMTCPYVTRLVAAAEAVLTETADDARVIVPGGCDAMRRLGDLLAAAYPGRVFVLAMPRSADARRPRGARRRTGRSGRVAAGTESGSADGASESRPQKRSRDRPATSTIRAHPGRAASSSSRARSATTRCCGSSPTWVPTSPDWNRARRRTAGSPCVGAFRAGRPLRRGRGRRRGRRPVDDAYERLAAAVLDAGMCPRRSTLARREHLARRLDQAHPSAVIYARQSFCDPGAYDALEVARLAEERGLPFLEIEVGFPFEASGPLRTRVEAFLETQSLDDDLLDDLDDLDDLRSEARREES